MRYLYLLSFLSPLLLSQLIPTGSLSNIGNLDSSADLYISDQGTCSPIYYKQNGQWIQLFSVGGSGALTCSGPQIDINTAVVPTLAGVDKFTGLTTFSQFQLAASPKKLPTCGQNNRGGFAFQNNGRAKDLVYVCGSSGSGMKWMPLN